MCGNVDIPMVNMIIIRKNEIMTGAASASMNASFFSVNKTPRPKERIDNPEKNVCIA